MLKIQVKSGDYLADDAAVLAVLVTQGALDRQRPFAELDRELGGTLGSLAKELDFEGKPDQVIDATTLGRLPCGRVVIVGLGPKRDVDAAKLRAGAAAAARAAIMQPSLALVGPRTPAARDLRSLAEGLELGAYRFTKYLTGDRLPKRSLEQASIYKGQGRPSGADGRNVALGQRVAGAVQIARDAVNEPPNELTPEALAQLARRVARKGKLKVTVLDEKGIRREKMALHSAVGQGSSNPPRFIHLTYSPRGAKKTLVFVGKGLTFDSGGLCIKPAPGMGEMKSDMGGAAAVLGLMAAVAETKPKVAVHGIVGAAENMPDGAAYRPADIIPSLDGKTVEVINTDAEGRLVLADALAYARKLEPDLIVDAATLTGACLVALGKTCSAFYTSEEKWARQFEGAVKRSGEQFWRMPLLEDLREQLNSDVADLKHTGERYGGSITAALFLREFVGEVPWIHCDIAGPVLGDRARGFYPKGATGHPVLTFLELVENAG